MAESDIFITAKGIGRTIRRLTSKSKYFSGRSQEAMQRVGEQGIELLKEAVTATGIKQRTGALLNSIAIKDLSPSHVVIGFTGDRLGVAEVLDEGWDYPAIEAGAGKVFALEKGPGEGIVFRKTIGERHIRQHGFVALATERIVNALGGRFTAEVRAEMRRKDR